MLSRSPRCSGTPKNRCNLSACNLSADEDAHKDADEDAHEDADEDTDEDAHEDADEEAGGRRQTKTQTKTKTQDADDDAQEDADEDAGRRTQDADVTCRMRAGRGALATTPPATMLSVCWWQKAKEICLQIENWFWS